MPDDPPERFQDQPRRISDSERSVPGFDRFGSVERDAESVKEGKAYKEGDLQRFEEKKQAAHFVSIWALRIFVLSLLVVFLIRIYHLVAPRCWGWLDENQIQTVDYLLFSGVIGGVIGGHMKQIFGLEH